jgi:type II secretion system protein G
MISAAKISRGFTLIELLVVIAIIGMLSSVVLGSLSSARSRGADAKRVSDMRTIVSALELYRSSIGSYPNTSSSWVSSYNNSAGNWITGLSPTYVPRIPVEVANNPWPNTPELMYYYISNGTDYCMQISQENNCSANPYYWGTWNGTCKLRVESSMRGGAFCLQF